MTTEGIDRSWACNVFVIKHVKAATNLRKRHPFFLKFLKLGFTILLFMPVMTKGKHFIFECSCCGVQSGFGTQLMYLCNACSKDNKSGEPPRGVMKVLYDYHRLRHKPKPFKYLKNRGFIDLLPISSLSSLPPLRTGRTPLYTFNKLDGKLLPAPLHIKDDSQNPTWSFKDRASALVSAFAAEHGLSTIVVASTGNAGSSMAGICASMKQRAVVVLPDSAPEAKLRQVVMYGAKALPIKGTYDQAFELSIELSNQFGWYNRNTAYNPLTIEGKKTVSFELFDQLPELLNGPVFVPVGDGVILSGVYKGFDELKSLGVITEVPKVVAVQAAQSDNLVRNLHQPDFISIRSTTIADSISVDAPRNFYMARQFIHAFDGDAITVSDNDILQASALLAQNTGLFAEPAAAAAFAGFLSYLHGNKLRPGDNPVVLLTGSGLKDLKSIAKGLTLPESVHPDFRSVERTLEKSGYL